MPLYVHSFADDFYSNYTAASYVSGPRLTHFHRRALEWRYSSLNGEKPGHMPSWWNLTWVIPLHLCQMLTFIVAFQAQTGTGQTWMSILTVLLVLPSAAYWRIAYLDSITHQLYKHHTVVRHTRVQFDELLRGRPDGFRKWLIAQLEPDGPYFRRVYPIIDSYLQGTNYGAHLCDELGHTDNRTAKIVAGIKDGAYQAYKLLKALYDEAVEAAERQKQEDDIRIASETKFREGEEARITAQRVQIALEDITTYVDGHQALTDLQHDRRPSTTI